MVIKIAKQLLVLSALVIAIATTISPILNANAITTDVSSSPEATVPMDLGLMSPNFPTGKPPKNSEVLLGKDLFDDAVLSSNGQISCATCHRSTHGFADNRALSLGINNQEGIRNTPTVWNAAFLDHLSWDGKNSSLEQQVLAALFNPKEMGLYPELLKARVEKKYGQQLREIYGESSADSVAKAIAAYQRTMVAGDSPFDRYLYGKQQDAISQSAKRGFKIFLGEARCVECHTIRCKECHPFGGSTALFTDNRFHNVGIGFNEKGIIEDLGRASITERPEDIGAFRTPTLRNIELTAPYMHNGSLNTLEEVIDHYNKGGISNKNLDPEMHELNFSERDKQDLIAFLKALTSVKLKAQIASQLK
ncbi:c-type cytochrome [Oculatella sp. LEGE 06141]|uniref:cytochrome-c peroxidase n=1 Tax=Oculatella sp. LEGE 06141 TaxID=1828648 RepID=UPI00187FF56D|nr:c-type cytochrome [Oculatella sp. LEGE 06141]